MGDAPDETHAFLGSGRAVGLRHGKTPWLMHTRYDRR